MMWRLLLMALAVASAVFPALAQSGDEAAPVSVERKQVDIEADRMEVLQKENRAIFTGNVDAKRGPVTLKTDKLVVTYSEVPQAGGEKKTDVTFLDAAGNVLIVTARQRITGRTARMDVKANKVTVEGGVTVKQGKTVLNGAQLLVDLDTDTSQLTGGRVKGSFVPQ